MMHWSREGVIIRWPSSTDRMVQSGMRPSKRWRAFGCLATGGIIVAALGVTLAALAALPVISPGTGAAVADGLRAVLGPQPVAELESVSFKIQDVWNRARYQLSG